MKGIQGKTVFITGGNSGIGKATALEFADKGANVVLAARRVKEGQDVVQQIQNKGGNAMFVQTDVTNEEQVANAIKTTVERFGSLDFAFNNSGVHLMYKPMHELDMETWNTIIDTNLKGVWLCLKHEIIQMRAQGKGGAIVNMSSMGGLLANPSVLSPYIASKHGVIGLSKSAALENAMLGIRVNAISPAVIRTDMVDTLAPEVIEPMRMAHALQRLGTTYEVANAVVWLCSEGAGFITGHTLVIDGGYSAQ